MNKIRDEIKKLADKYGIQIIYGFGSITREAADFLEGKISRMEPGLSAI